jgi:RNA polymerase sigma factor (sigma-70 family)
MPVRPPRTTPQPHLTRRAERRLVLAARARGAPEREQLVEAFLPLIGSVARIYRGSPAVDRRELMQEGVVGLLRALDRYDVAQETPFWAYASWWVRQAMQQLVSELTWPVVLSDRALRQLARVKDARTRLLQERGREPSLAELADATGLRLVQVENLIAAERKPRALEEPLGGAQERGATFGEVLSDPKAEDAFDVVPRRVAAEQVQDLLGSLNPRECAILRGRYGLDGDERTLRDLAEGIGVSAERVRQIEQGALEKLRAVTVMAAPARA